MTKLELTSSWPTVVRMAGEGASLREIAEEVNATPGAINQALKRNGIEKAPAPPWPSCPPWRRSTASEGAQGTQGQGRASTPPEGRQGAQSQDLPRGSCWGL